MRQDQYERLQQIEEKLADIFIAEADPGAWPMPGTPSANLTADARKERYMFKRAASETAMLLVRTQNLIGAVQGAPDAPLLGQPAPPAEAEADEAAVQSALDRDIDAVEHQAERMRADLIRRAQKAARGDAAPR